jgi:hypothetical protein
MSGRRARIAGRFQIFAGFTHGLKLRSLMQNLAPPRNSVGRWFTRDHDAIGAKQARPGSTDGDRTANPASTHRCQARRAERGDVQPDAEGWIRSRKNPSIESENHQDPERSKSRTIRSIPTPYDTVAADRARVLGSVDAETFDPRSSVIAQSPGHLASGLEWECESSNMRPTSAADARSASG